MFVPQVVRLRRSIRFVSGAALVVSTVLFLTASAKATDAAPMQVTVGVPIERAGIWVYPVAVRAAGDSVAILATGRVTVPIILTVNGVIRARAGGEARTGLQPFGHSVASLELNGLTPRDHVELRSTGEPQTFMVVSNLRFVVRAAHLNLFAGMYYCFLAMVTLVQLVLAVTLRERMNLWYAAWALAILTMIVGRDGFYGTNGFAVTMVAVFSALIMPCLGGFVASYLRLSREAPQLLWALIGVNAIAAIGGIVLVPFLHGYAGWLQFLTTFLVSASMLAIALQRWRSGFSPAGALSGSLGVVVLTSATLVILRFERMNVQWLTDWSLQVATVCDIFILAGATAVRQRYISLESERLQLELRTLADAAMRDPLTSLLNRRGLDEWLQMASEKVATVLFIDLDGFKAVNDRGGHAAGDDILRIVSRIIRRNVRDCDAVARVGGDEFVVAFTGENSPEGIANWQARIGDAIANIEPLGSDDDLRIGASIGIGFISQGISFDDALRAADADAYRVKSDHYARKRKTLAIP
jgi:diguanylate cyclase (GGDEF)-like protein